MNGDLSNYILKSLERAAFVLLDMKHLYYVEILIKTLNI